MAGRLTLARMADLAQADIREIQQLDASKLDLSDLDDLSPCVELKRLDLSGNRLQSLVPLADNRGLTWLNVSHNALESLNGVQKLQALKVLNVSGNEITRSVHISPLRALQALILNNNGLKRVEGLETLTQLNTLVLSHNEIESLELPKLENLAKLAVSHNRLRALPDLQACYQLKQLRVNDNKLVFLPDSLGLLARLELLDVGNNPIRELAGVQVTAQLPALTNFNCKGTPLAVIAENMVALSAMLPKLRILNGASLAPTKKKFKRRMEGPVVEGALSKTRKTHNSKDEATAKPINTVAGFDEAKLVLDDSVKASNPQTKSSRERGAAVDAVITLAAGGHNPADSVSMDKKFQGKRKAGADLDRVTIKRAKLKGHTELEESLEPGVGELSEIARDAAASKQCTQNRVRVKSDTVPIKGQLPKGFAPAIAQQSTRVPLSEESSLGAKSGVVGLVITNRKPKKTKTAGVPDSATLKLNPATVAEWTRTAIEPW